MNAFRGQEVPVMPPIKSRDTLDSFNSGPGFCRCTVSNYGQLSLDCQNRSSSPICLPPSLEGELRRTSPGSVRLLTCAVLNQHVLQSEGNIPRFGMGEKSLGQDRKAGHGQE